MALTGMRNVRWGFADLPLLENITFQIEKGERVGLLGRNGEGKFSLLRILNGEFPPDQGEVWRQQGITVAALPQQVPPGIDGTIFDVVAEGLGPQGRALAQYRKFASSPQCPGNLSFPKKRGEHQQLSAGDDRRTLSRRISKPRTCAFPMGKPR
jgi:ABC transport system ATP-binding/permease protein